MEKRLAKFLQAMSILAAIAVLALLILVHEMGHFLAARAQGIYANRFSIGFGPVIWKYQGPETEYALRALPLGGFVGFPDDDPDSDIPADDPNLLRNRPILDRAIVISAGVIANLLFAFFVLVAQVGIFGVEEAQQPGVLIPKLAVEVSEVSPQAAQAGVKPGDVFYLDGKQLNFAYTSGAPTGELVTSAPGEQIPITAYRAEAGKQDFLLSSKAGAGGQGYTGIRFLPTEAIKAGLEPKDVVLSANGQEYGRSLEAEDSLRKLIEGSANQPIQMTIQRAGATRTLAVTPRTDAQGRVRIGVALSPNGPENAPTTYRRPGNLFTIFSLAADRFQRIVTLTAQGFFQLISNFSKTADQVAGPVAIVAIGADIARSSIAKLFEFSALISINLAIINILPLPALDGGQLAFLAIEGLRGKPLPSRIQEGVMQTGLVLLLGLGIFLIIRDTAKFLPQ